MSRRQPTLIGRLFSWLLERAYLHTGEKCAAYGGTMADGRVRTCEKERWHLDSHAYSPEPGRLH